MQLGAYLTASLSSTLPRKDGAILYGGVSRPEMDFVNCSYKYLLNVGLCLCECVENAVNDRFVCFFPFCSSLQLFLYNCLIDNSWWRGAVVERRSLAGDLSLSCARPAADG